MYMCISLSLDQICAQGLFFGLRYIHANPLRPKGIGGTTLYWEKEAGSRLLSLDYNVFSYIFEGLA
jgi:hypothetical protein